MKTINLNLSTLDLQDKEVIKKASDEFDRGDFFHAYDHFFTLYNQGVDIQGLQLSIGLCCLKLNKRRQSRLFLFREVLDFPNNKEALAILNDQISKINGLTIVKNFSQTTWPEKVPEISLVLIVKNEEKDLARCLNSFKDIVKEIIVVDTGSTDRTVEIAKSFGARVEYFEWCNDFAAARNESLKYATCDWILRTDADEYIEDSEKAKLLHCVNSNFADVYMCPTISVTQYGDQIDRNVRLIKNHLGVKYRFPIHETIIFSIKDLGLKQCMANINFMHTGYVFNDAGADTKKTLRNLEVCEKYLALYPQDYYVRLIRNLFLINSSIHDTAIKDFEEVIKNLPDDTLSIKYLGLAYFLLAQDYLKNKKDVELSKILMDMQTDFFFDTRMMQFVGEIYYYIKGDWKKANKFFIWSCSRETINSDFEAILPAEKYNQKVSYQLMAESLVLQHEYDKARKIYQKIDKLNDSAEDQIASSAINDEKKITLLGHEELRELSKSLRDKSEWLNSYRMTSRAASKSNLDFQDLINMTFCQMQEKNFELALSLLDEARSIDSKSILVINFESLIFFHQNKYEKALEKAVEAFIKEPSNLNYQKNVQEIAKTLNLSPVEAIKTNGLKWINSNRLSDGLFALMMYLKFEPDDSEISKIIQKYMK